MTVFVVVVVLALMVWWEWRHGKQFFKTLWPRRRR
jgi:hypothetical protein